MSTYMIAAAPARVQRNPESSHRRLLFWGYVAFVAMLLMLTAYGFDYYRLDSLQRPISSKHALLKPSGPIGLKLGYVGLAMFFTIFLYPIRRRWQWLSQKGSSKHWLNFHMLLGVMAPFVIAFHASFKFSGFAGMAFWIMVAVAISGVIGRYVYGQIPRSITAAEISMRDLQGQHAILGQRLAQQKIVPVADMQFLLRLPKPERVSRMWLLTALGYMIALDITRPLRVARVRRHALTFSGKLRSIAGFRRTGNWDLEWAIGAVRDQAKLSKRILFLSRARDVFQLWHVIHRPFSYSFLVLALIHIAVVSVLGFVRW
ncbi:MAG: hypothetical protein JO065_00795 [Acidobacteria bacterium]|nr:hypothetical protein [Acidobacteriota bacterium]